MNMDFGTNWVKRVGVQVSWFWKQALPGVLYQDFFNIT